MKSIQLFSIIVIIEVSQIVFGSQDSDVREVYGGSSNDSSELTR